MDDTIELICFFLLDEEFSVLRSKSMHFAVCGRMRLTGEPHQCGSGFPFVFCLGASRVALHRFAAGGEWLSRALC